MDINLDMHMDLLNTPVPNFFIDNYMICSEPVYSLVYIYIYKECLYGKKKLKLANIAQKFGLLDLDIVKCLSYWQEKKLIEYNQTGDNLFIKFLSVSKEEVIKKNAPRILDYTPEELAFWEKNDQIGGLFEFARDILERLLDHRDLNVLFGMYNDLKLPFDVIKILLEYCVKNKHNDINYIKKTAIDWAQNKIFDVVSAEKKINYFDDSKCEHEKLFNEVKSALVARNLNPAQKKIILSWYDSGVPEELIIEACNVVMLNTGTPNFKYIGKIIRSWKRNNIKTVEEARKLDAEDQDFKLKKVAAKNRFANFEQREWDFDELKKITCDTGD